MSGSGPVPNRTNGTVTHYKWYYRHELEQTGQDKPFPSRWFGASRAVMMRHDRPSKVALTSTDALSRLVTVVEQCPIMTVSGTP